MGGSLYNKIPLGRRAAFYHMSRRQIALIFGSATGVALMVLMFKLLK